jgi:hypothetical protein
VTHWGGSLTFISWLSATYALERMSTLICAILQGHLNPPFNPHDLRSGWRTVPQANVVSRCVVIESPSQILIMHFNCSQQLFILCTSSTHQIKTKTDISLCVGHQCHTGRSNSTVLAWLTHTCITGLELSFHFRCRGSRFL